MSRIRLHSVCPSVFITASLRLSSAESPESIMVAYCLSLQQAPCHCGKLQWMKWKGRSWTLMVRCGHRWVVCTEVLLTSSPDDWHLKQWQPGTVLKEVFVWEKIRKKWRDRWENDSSVVNVFFEIFINVHLKMLHPCLWIVLDSCFSETKGFILCRARCHSCKVIIILWKYVCALSGQITLLDFVCAVMQIDFAVTLNAAF